MTPYSVWNGETGGPMDRLRDAIKSQVRQWRAYARDEWAARGISERHGPGSRAICEAYYAAYSAAADELSCTGDLDRTIERFVAWADLADREGDTPGRVVYREAARDVRRLRVQLSQWWREWDAQIRAARGEPEG